MTYSSGRSRLPSKIPAYRSNARPALKAKLGSRGKIHERVCHGLIASSCSQRQIVDADASVTPRSITSRCSSVRENRPSGRPCVTGSSHAIALTSATCCGGKTARATRARLVLQTIQAIVEEPPSPLADDPGRRVQSGCDLGVMQPLGGIEHDPRALDFLPRTLLRPRDPDQLATLVLAEFDPVTGPARHHQQLQRTPPDSFTDSDAYFRTRLLALGQLRLQPDQHLDRHRVGAAQDRQVERDEVAEQDERH